MKSLLHARVRGAIALALAAMLLLSLAGPAAAANPGRPFLGAGGGPSTLGAPIASCPAGSMWYATATGTGTFTHLGRATYALQHCAAADMTTGDGWTVGKGSLTFVAANGDRLEMVYDMTFHATPMPLPTTATGSIDWTITGGTGRFVGARGSGTAAVDVQYAADLSGADIFMTWSGRLWY